MVCLNGTIEGIPDKVTFSTSQYAQRLSSPDHLYARLVSEILSRPIVFVGTKIDESPLWQSIETRRRKGSRGTRELRPRSYLITPELDRPREDRLATFNIVWIKMTAREFSEEVLEKLNEASQKGFGNLGELKKYKRDDARIDFVSDLSTRPEESSEFLLGSEPIWADIQSDRAIFRESDEKLEQIFRDCLKTSEVRGIIIVTGTAGSGKSTSLMRLALKASAEGLRVGWVDRTTNLSARELISAMNRDDSPEILIIDEAEIFRNRLPHTLRDIVFLEKKPLVLVSIRATAVDRFINPVILNNIPQHEVTVRHLADSDIDALLNVLDRENRLGVLKGKSINEQRRKFRNFAGRQLLVAMISATSGRRFDEKIWDEFEELPQRDQLIYATVCMATTFRCTLSRQDILTALNETTNEVLNTIQSLLNRHILVESPRGSGHLRARHRLIAERVRSELQRSGQLVDVVNGLGFLAAMNNLQMNSQEKNSNNSRLLRSIISHKFLRGTIGPKNSQLFYHELEDYLSGDSHYWLQRGSLEVECGDLHLAENFLGQARALAPDDRLVDNEWAYLLFRKALSNPLSTNASDMVEEAMGILESLIADSASRPHPFHILGRQGLEWSRCGIVTREDRVRYLRKLISLVEKGLVYYPNNQDLINIHEDLRREYMTLGLSTPQ